MKSTRILLRLLAALLFFTAFRISHAQSYSIDWHKVAGGGGTSTNSQFSLSGTIGQPDASGALTNGQFSVVGGFWALIQLVQTPGAPLLSITYSGNQAIVSWPSPSVGFTLQTNANLTTGVWGNYSGISGDDGAIKTATNAPSLETLFFRLAHP